MNGTTGEGPLSLTTEERMELAEAWMRQKHLVPTIIIQVAGCDLKSAQKLVREDFLHLGTWEENG